MRYRKTENTFALLGGAVLGAAAMYLLDPESGRRRRAHVSELTGEALRSTGEAIGPAWEQLSDRARDVGQRLSEGAQSFGSSFSERAQGARDAGSSAAGSAYGGARDWLSGWGESIGDWGRSIGRRFSRSASDAGDRARDYRDRARDTARDYAGRARAMLPWAEEESHATAYTVAGLSAAALGAAAIYLFDPTNGRGRRKMVADKATRIVNDTGRAFRQAGRYATDMMNRGRGLAHETRFRVHAAAQDVSPETLVQRVRSEMGHVVSNAGAITVVVDGDRNVTLTGNVPTAEVDRLLSTVHQVPGVNQVINRLDVQDTMSGFTNTAGAAGQRL